MPVLLALTDRSGSIASGGAAQNVMAANPNRVGWSFYNSSDTAMFVNDVGVATSTAGYQVAPGAHLDFGEDRRVSMQAISVLCATTGKTFVAREW